MLCVVRNFDYACCVLGAYGVCCVLCMLCVYYMCCVLHVLCVVCRVNVRICCPVCCACYA